MFAFGLNISHKISNVRKNICINGILYTNISTKEIIENLKDIYVKVDTLGIHYILLSHFVILAITDWTILFTIPTTKKIV